MILYHGSLEIIRKPAILEPNRTMDYGKGFYTTTSKDQADKWVARKISATGTDKGFTNIYSFDESRFETLNVLKFDSANEQWLDFVMQNRTEKNFSHDYDIVYGPVANDRVYAAFALYEDGMIDKEGLIKELRAYKLADQVLFHSIKSLEYLHFENIVEVCK